MSTDGRTVTSHKANNMDNSQLIEVWDSGKSSLCQVNIGSSGSGVGGSIRVTSFLQSRLINKNCLFVCVKNTQLDVLEEGHHEMRCYEIGKDGQSV